MMGNLRYRKALYLMVKTMVSCRFSLKPIQWLFLFRCWSTSFVIQKCNVPWSEVDMTWHCGDQGFGTYTDLQLGWGMHGHGHGGHGGHGRVVLFLLGRQASISQAQGLGQKQGDTCALDWEIWEDFAEGLSAVKMVCHVNPGLINP